MQNKFEAVDISRSASGWSTGAAAAMDDVLKFLIRPTAVWVSAGTDKAILSQMVS
jgi:hypothetical protein